MTDEKWAKIRDGQTWHGDLCQRAKDGREFWVDVTVVPCLDDDGRVYQCITIRRDITLRKNLEKQLKHMVENLPGGAVLINADGFSVNREIEKLTGYARDEFKTIDDWFRIIFRHEAERMRELYENARASGFTSNNTVPIFTKNGETRRVEFLGYYDSESEIWLLHDLTETFAAQERFRLLFEHSVDGQIIVEEVNDTLIIREANPAAIRMVGAKNKAAMVGRSPSDFAPHHETSRINNAEQFDAQHRQVGQGQVEFEWDRMHADGTIFPVRVNSSPAQLDGKSVYLITWHNLKNERDAQAKLIQSSKMHSLGEMSGGLSHELNTPLATIKGMVQQLSILQRAERLTPEKLIEGLTKVEASTDRMARIVSALKYFAQDSDSIQPERESLASIVGDALTFCRTRLEAERIALDLRVPDDLEIVCRSWEVTQAILNLIKNSIDAVEATENKWIKIEAQRINERVELRITDGGPGLPLFLHEKIMEPFFTTKEIGEGTGLGLCVSRGIIEAHQGRLELDVTSVNTSFVITFANAI